MGLQTVQMLLRPRAVSWEFLVWSFRGWETYRESGGTMRQQNFSYCIEFADHRHEGGFEMHIKLRIRKSAWTGAGNSRCS